MEQMRLLGLDDRIGAIDAGAIAIDQIGALIKTVPPQNWGDAAKALPEDFIKEVCKQGAVSNASSILSQYGPAAGAGLLVGAASALVTKNPVVWLATGLGAGLVYYMFVTGGAQNA